MKAGGKSDSSSGSAPHFHEDLRERKPPFWAYRKAVEFRQGPALEPDSESTAKAHSDRDPRLAVVPTRAIIIATPVNRPIIAAVSSRIRIWTWVVAVRTGLVVTIGRLAGVTGVRYGGDRRFVIGPFIAVPVDPAVLRGPIPPIVVMPSVAPLIAALIGCNPGVGIAGNAGIWTRDGRLGYARIAAFVPSLSRRYRTEYGCWS